MRNDFLLIEEGGRGASRFFTALETALRAIGREDAIAGLDGLARTALCLAKALRLMRLKPAEMRSYAGGPEQVYRDFERASSEFCVRWTGGTHGLQFKGYGWHMWASLPELFRRYGCLELINQDPMEQTVQRMGEAIAKCQHGDCGGARRKGVSDEEHQADLDARRAAARTQSHILYNHMQQHAMDTVSAPIPKDKDTNRSLIDIRLAIDNARSEGKVITYAQYVQYWYRWFKKRGWPQRRLARFQQELRAKWAAAMDTD